MSNAGQAITTAVFTTVGFFIGGPAGAAVGFSIGMGVGSALFPTEGEVPNPARGLDVQTSQYGTAIPYVIGQEKLAGNLLWHGNFTTSKIKVKTGLFGSKKTVGYNYYASFAWGLCVVPTGKTVTLVGAWAGNDPIPLEDVQFYGGNQTTPDSHLTQFVTRAPVWKNICYVVIPSYHLGQSTYVPNFTFEIKVGTLADVSPTVVVNDILTNDLFGAGIDPALIDSASASATATYCTDNDLLVSFAIGQQMSMLDGLAHVIAYHNGYISYSGGVIAHKQMQAVDQPPVIRDIDMVRQPGEMPAQASYQGGRDYKNRVTVEYSKRDAHYVIGTAPFDDPVDIGLYGLRDITIKLTGFKTYSRAEKMARDALRKSLSAPQGIEFTLGPKAAGIRPGDVIGVYIPDMEIDSAPYRVASISEDENYQTVISAVEDRDTYDLISTGSDTSTPSTPISTSLTGAPGTVQRPMVIEVPAIYSPDQRLAAVSYTRPAATVAFAGGIVYQAYALTGSYTPISEGTGDGVTGAVIAVGSGTIDVQLDSDDTLTSLTSFDEMVMTRTSNLAVFRASGGDRFVRCQTVELIAANQWRLSGLIYDSPGVPTHGATGDIATGNSVMFTHEIPHALELSPDDPTATLYYKVVAYNLAGSVANPLDSDVLTVTYKNLMQRPLPPANIACNGVGLHDGTTTVAAGLGASITWVSRNKAASGSTNFARTDTVLEDDDFSHYLVEVYHVGGGILRSEEVTTPAYDYTAIKHAGDINMTPLTFKIYKVGNSATSDAATFTITYN